MKKEKKRPNKIKSKYYRVKQSDQEPMIKSDMETYLCINLIRKTIDIRIQAKL